jgi:hypothetical protein
MIGTRTKIGRQKKKKQQQQPRMESLQLKIRGKCIPKGYLEAYF